MACLDGTGGEAWLLTQSTLTGQGEGHPAPLGGTREEETEPRQWPLPSCYGFQVTTERRVRACLGFPPRPRYQRLAVWT